MCCDNRKASFFNFHPPTTIKRAEDGTGRITWIFVRKELLVSGYEPPQTREPTVQPASTTCCGPEERRRSSRPAFVSPIGWLEIKKSSHSVCWHSICWLVELFVEHDLCVPHLQGPTCPCGPDPFKGHLEQPWHLELSRHFEHSWWFWAVVTVCAAVKLWAVVRVWAAVALWAVFTFWTLVILWAVVPFWAVVALWAVATLWPVVTLWTVMALGALMTPWPVMTGGAAVSLGAVVTFCAVVAVERMGQFEQS